MTATINGVAWRPEKVTGTRTGNRISVGAQSTRFPILSIAGEGVTGPGTYRVTDDIFAAAQASFAVADENGLVVTDLGGTGALVIHSWSAEQAAGSFSFTAGQGNGLHSVSGSFTVTF